MVVLGLLAVVSLSACGSSGDDSGSGSEGDPRLAAAIEQSLGRDIEARLQRQFRDKAFRVTTLRCTAAAAENVQCVVRARDSAGASGNIGVAVVVDPARGTALAQFTGTSRGRWAALLNRGAARQQAAARQRAAARQQADDR